jgi:Flp pilus assembly protein TadG
MRNRLFHLRDDERGMSLVFVGGSLLAFLTATTLAIDVGMFMTARSQSQNAADAGALAGATALAFDSFTDRTATGPAKSSAVDTALKNMVINDTVAVTPDDVQFLTGPSGVSNRVQVSVYRDTAHNKSIPTLLGGLFGIGRFNVWAQATAEAAPANAIRCVKPFMIPDRWEERRPTTTTFNPNTSEFEMYDNHGNLLSPADYYNGDLSSPAYTGYNPDRDKGMELIIRAGTGNNIFPTMYYSWNMPGNDQGIIGADWYNMNIAGCNQFRIPLPGPGRPDFLMIQEPGAMTGPTIDGVQALYDQDPHARWDTECRCVKDSDFGGHSSPRIFPIPVFDPVYYATGKQNGRNADFKLANIIGIFLSQRPDSNQIYGRIVPLLGEIDPTAGPAPAGTFATAIRLVQ